MKSKQIKKLEPEKIAYGETAPTVSILTRSDKKINELVDAVNEIVRFINT